MRIMTKRMSYSNGFKLKVVELAMKHGNRSARREYGVNEKLLQAARSRPGVMTRWPELENRIFEWVIERRMNGIGTSGTMIHLKAGQWLRICLLMMLRASLVVRPGFTTSRNERILY